MQYLTLMNLENLLFMKEGIKDYKRYERWKFVSGKRDTVHFGMTNSGRLIMGKIAKQQRNKLQMFVKCIFLEEENN